MNPVQTTLQGLPSSFRKVLYWVVAILGLTLGVLQAADVEDLGPITMTQALNVFAFLSPIAGLVAVANVSKPNPAEDSSGLGDLVADMDLSGFEPVGDIDDVYGPGADTGTGAGMGSDVDTDAFATAPD